jgi:hypothetical protein
MIKTELMRNLSINHGYNPAQHDAQDYTLRCAGLIQLADISALRL